MISELLEVFCDTAEKNCSLKYPISLKELEAEGGIYAEAGEGMAESKTYTKAATVQIPILILIRDTNQQTCISNLETLCNYFSKLKTYPKAKKFKWLDSDIGKYVSKIGRDADGTYHYSCIINCKIYKC